jgi:hypothetical protein
MHSNSLLDLFIIIAVSIYFAYVLRVSLRKIYLEYKKPPWQSTAAMLGLAAFFILLRVVVEFRPSPDSNQTLINLAFFFALTSVLALVGR